MKKSIGLSLVAATLLAGNVAAMDLAGGTLGGDARLQYFGMTPSDTDATSSVGLGLNPVFSMEVASNLSIEVGAGVAMPVSESDDAVAGGNAHGKVNDDGDGSEMYALLNKYNVTYSFADGFVKVGAQDLDTPYAGADDIRLVPNTFTAAVLGYTGVKNVTLIAAQVMSMAGAVDGSADDAETFNSMSTQVLGSGATVDDTAVTALAAVYGNEEAGANGQLWYYMMPEPISGIGAVSAMYLDADMTFGIVNIAAQYGSFDVADYYSNTFTGVKAEIAATEDVAVIAAMNNFSYTENGVGAAAGTQTPLWYGWGGYPEYAVADELWANNADWDGGSASKVAVAYSGVENLDLAAGYVSFSDVGTGIDIIAGYAVNEQISANLVYESVTYDDTNPVGDDGHTVTKISASYAF
jgi:hypothetical protein